jgi:hypothetical protein
MLPAMATIAFDTLKLARRLEAAGFPREQAAGAAEAIAEVVGEAIVTRDYLDRRLGETDARITAVEANLRAHIADVRADLLKRVIGLLLGQTAIIAALVKLL